MVKIIYYSVVILVFVIGFIIVIVICYYKIFKIIWKYVKVFVLLLLNGSSVFVNIFRWELWVSIFLFVVVIVFVFCWILLWVIVLMFWFKFFVSFFRNVILFVMFLVFIFLIVNFFIYVGMNGIFWNEFCYICKCLLFLSEVLIGY